MVWGEMLLEGALYLGGVDSKEECVEENKYFIDKTVTSWAYPDVWASPRFNEATPDAERVPCSDDSVEFPSNSEFSLFLPELTQHIQELKIGNQYYDTVTFKDRALEENTAQQFYHNNHQTTGVVVEENKCRSQANRGCPCQEFTLEINCESKYCAVPACSQPIKPIGHCCKVCGGAVSFEREQSFHYMEFKEFVDKIVASYKDSSIVYHVGIIPPNTVQVVIVEKGEYTGLSTVIANDIDGQLSRHWYLGVEALKMAEDDELNCLPCTNGRRKSVGAQHAEIARDMHRYDGGDRSLQLNVTLGTWTKGFKALNSPLWHGTHSAVRCTACPWHGAPPFSGCGSVQLRVRRWPPVARPLQRHWDHGPHGLQPPLVKLILKYKIMCKSQELGVSWIEKKITACVSWQGFQLASNTITRLAPTRLMPSEPARVDTRNSDVGGSTREVNDRPSRCQIETSGETNGLRPTGLFWSAPSFDAGPWTLGIVHWSYARILNRYHAADSRETEPENVQDKDLTRLKQSSSLCDGWPLQGAPPLAGAGSVQDRVRRRPLASVPHRHGSHADHSDQPPFTKYDYKSYHIKSLSLLGRRSRLVSRRSQSAQSALYRRDFPLLLIPLGGLHLLSLSLGVGLERRELELPARAQRPVQHGRHAPLRRHREKQGAHSDCDSDAHGQQDLPMGQLAFVAQQLEESVLQPHYHRQHECRHHHVSETLAELRAERYGGSVRLFV
ncbi:hypothetical protein MSG28_007782 [Choristoneura fumiferana]|uniref:Uncharacterized protein n=1 Tax=Choristoneura fumiferana TaxID=7141 RepID=A0ACC0JYF3_CHOFU|nr:hypothetical protein MSG28_007782 [Choristoneura fumiferana]